jgi:hypothetical protein
VSWTSLARLPAGSDTSVSVVHRTFITFLGKFFSSADQQLLICHIQQPTVMISGPLVPEGAGHSTRTGTANLHTSTASVDQRQKGPVPPVNKHNLFQWKKIYSVLTYTPPNCRWDPKHPPQFSMAMNVLFAFAAGFTVANLYYNHPILNILARDFGVRYEEVAQIPTVMQAGYATGLLFLCPLGDLVPRRPFVCGLVFFTATMW